MEKDGQEGYFTTLIQYQSLSRRVRFYGLSKRSVTRDFRDTFVTRDYLDRSVSNAGQILGIIATEPLPVSIRTDLLLQVCSHDRSVTKDDRDNSVMVNALPIYYAFVHGPIGSIGTCQSLIIGPALRIVKSEFELQSKKWSSYLKKKPELPRKYRYQSKKKDFLI